MDIENISGECIRVFVEWCVCDNEDGGIDKEGECEEWDGEV